MTRSWTNTLIFCTSITIGAALYNYFVGHPFSKTFESGWDYFSAVLAYKWLTKP